jgi:hypothetical protein
MIGGPPSGGRKGDFSGKLREERTNGVDQSQQKLVNEAVLPSTFSSYRGNLEEAQKRDNG